MPHTRVKPGDIILTGRIGKVYLYLGYYSGKPRDYGVYEYTEGHLYVFLGLTRRAHMADTVNTILQYIQEIDQFDHVDGYIRYTKRPISYLEVIRSVDLTPYLFAIEHVYGLTRTGGRRRKEI